MKSWTYAVKVSFMDKGVNKPDQIVSEIEKDVSTMKWSHQRADKFFEAGKLYKEQGDVLKSQQMAWEMALFYLNYTNYKYRKKTKQRFTPKLTYSNGSVFPDLKSFSQDSVEYFRKRAKETANPIHRARYSEIVWELQRAHQYARMAIDSYLKCVPIFMKNGWMYELADSLLRASELALSLNDLSEITKAKENVLKAMKDLAKTKQYRFCLELIDALVELKGNVKKTELNLAVQVALEGAKYYETEVTDGFLLQRAFLERVILLSKTLGKQGEVSKYNMEIGRSYEKEAEWKLKHYPLGHSVAASIYEDAARKYADLGISGKVTEMKKKIQEHYRIAAKKEMRVIVSKVSIPSKPIEAFMDKFSSLSLSDALKTIAEDKNLLPDVSLLRKKTEQQKKLAPVSFVIPRVSIRNENPALTSRNESEIFEHHLVENIGRVYKIISDKIGLALRKLAKERELNANSFTAFLEKSKTYEREKLEIIKIGMERYFAGDYVSAIHVLVPQLEATLRKVLETLGEPTISMRQGAIREKPLDEVLRSPKMESFLGLDLSYYLKVFLVDKRGDNLRHDIAHGLINKQRCNENITNIVLHQLLILSQLAFPDSTI